MSIAGRINRAGTLHTWAVSADRNDLGDYDSGFTDHPVYAEVQQTSSVELRGGQMTVVTHYLGFFRPRLDGPGGAVAAGTLTPEDEVTVDGARYTLDGDPWLVRNPRTGIASHWETRLRKVT